MLYRRVEIVDGESTEPVQFVAVSPFRWPAGLEAQAAFVEADAVEARLDAGDALAVAAEKIENALEILFERNFVSGDGEARAALRELSAALHQYKETTE